MTAPAQHSRNALFSAVLLLISMAVALGVGELVLRAKKTSRLAVTNADSGAGDWTR